jgi:hypothetical protein
MAQRVRDVSEEPAALAARKALQGQYADVEQQLCVPASACLALLANSFVICVVPIIFFFPPTAPYPFYRLFGCSSQRLIPIADALASFLICIM